MSLEETGVRVAEMVRVMVEGLVDRPENVTVVLSLHGRLLVMSVTVAERDYGRVIGREGKTARSLRTIVDAVSQKHHVRCDLSFTGDRNPSREGKR